MRSAVSARPAGEGDTPVQCSWWGFPPCCNAQLAALVWAPWSHQLQQRFGLSQRCQGGGWLGFQEEDGSAVARRGPSLHPPPCGTDTTTRITCHNPPTPLPQPQPTAATHLPSLISKVMDRDTTSREARSLATGAYRSMNLSPLLLSR